MKTSQGSSVPRRRSATTYAWCAGAWPGVAIAVTSVFPSSTRSPSSSAWWGKSTFAPAGRYAVAPVAATSSGSPETWSAWTCVSSTATISPAAAAPSM